MTPTAPVQTSPERRRFGWQWIVRAVGSLILAALLLVVLPRVTGTRWSEIANVVARLDAADVAVLTAVWLAGLWVYAFVITASVPGMRHAQAMTVNVASSAVSNLAPLGGALGLAATFGMARTWGFSSGAVALSAVVTGIWNVFAKLALPMVGLLALVLDPEASSAGLARPAAVGAAGLAVALAVLIGTLWSGRVAKITGRLAEAVGEAGLRLTRSRRRITWDQAVPRWRRRVVGLVREGWITLSIAMIGYLSLQALLLYLTLGMLGSTLGPAQVLAGFAFGRLLTTIVVTPGGTGFAETGTAGLLVALGGDPAVCTSGVLLFSGFVVFLEIPLGALGYLVWLLRRSWRRGDDRPAVVDPGQPRVSSLKSSPASRGEPSS